MFVVDDLLDAVLLGSFFFGLIFSAIALVVGIADLGLGHAGHGGDAGHGHDGGSGSGHGHQFEVAQFLNIGSVLAFFTWFGGVAYLVRHGLEWAAALSLVLGLAAGLVGGYAVVRLLRLLRSGETVLRSEDYRMPGTIARVTSSIRVGGTGEVVYEQGGVRQVSAARSATGMAIPRGTDVVILDREHGIASVEPWASLIGDEIESVANRSQPTASDPPAMLPH